MISKKFLLWKVLAIWVLFLLLHFSYERFPNTLFLIIGEEGETSYFHMKMLFFAYIFTTIAEYFLKRKKLVNPVSFVYSRMLVAVIFPWLTISLWFSTQALGIEIFPIIPWEIIYSNIITLIGVYFAVRADEALESIEYRPSFRNLITIFFASALLGYISFSFNPPEHFFSTPDEAGHGD
ncbi:MAG: hypothetical protein HQ525_10525 [Anaerolineae bacterium]|nr:hypothetical protein [Anaerolineae bacterium]